jgi:hypothetical protein
MGERHMDQTSDYDRSAHEASCPCNYCIGFDIAFAKQEGLRAEQWQPEGLYNWLRNQRQKKLNWDLPDGHCLICGGTTIHAWYIKDHYEIKRYNTVEKDGKFYTSMMIHKDSPIYAVYLRYVKREGLFAKQGYAESYQIFKVWVSQLLDLSPANCIGFASREHEDWIEIRLGFTKLVEETFEDRLAKHPG